MARIYLASSWRNAQQPEIVALLRHLGHEVYDFRHPAPGLPGFAWEQIDTGWLGWTAAQYRDQLLIHPRAAQGFLTDFRAMEAADTCVLLLPCGRSAHLEAGWFAGRGKRLIILTRDGEEPELMALMANHICVSTDELCACLGTAATRESVPADITPETAWQQFLWGDEPGLWREIATAPVDGSSFDVVCLCLTGHPLVVEDLHYGWPPIGRDRMILWGAKNFLSPQLVPVLWRPRQPDEQRKAG